MRIPFFVFLLLPILSAGQYDEHIIAFEKSIPPNLGKRINLPEPGYNANFNIDAIADYRIKTRTYVITSDSVYRRIFWQYRFTKDSLKIYSGNTSDYYYQWMVRHLRDSVPAFDFSKQELVLYSACGQCLAYCHHEEGDDACHRNVCIFMHAWFVRDKQPPYFVKNERFKTL